MNYLSNLPPGCTANDLPGWNPSTFTPPLLECDACHREFDPEEEMHIILDGQPWCEECRELCGGNCGEYLKDDTVASCGPVVHYRDWVYDGKLVAAHASCAAETILGYYIHGFDYDHTTREEVAAVFEMAVAR